MYKLRSGIMRLIAILEIQNPSKVDEIQLAMCRDVILVQSVSIKFVLSFLWGSALKEDQLWKGYSGGRTMVITHITPLRTFHSTIR